MKIKIIVDTGYLCNWRNIEPLQPEGFKGQTANEKETLKNSIVKNGFHDAFDVWQHEGRLLSIDGVHRKIALLELAEEGYEIPEQLPCAYVTAANETEAATIILSRNSQHSHILSAAVMTAAFKIPAATIEAVVPQKNLEAWNETEQDNVIQLTAEEDDFEFEDGGIETDIVIGDLFEIGEHRLLCGDSTDSDAVAKLMNGEKADMVFTDPPYGMGYKSNAWDSEKSEVRQKKTDTQILNDEDTNVGQEALNLMPLFLQNDRHFYVWCRWDCFNDFKQVCQNIGKIKSVIVWDKGGPGLGDLKGSYGDSEWAIFGMIGRRELNERQNGVWQVNRMKGLQMQHPTQKPIEICERGIKNSTQAGELVLDLFLGSGTTMVASHQLNRKCYGMELEPKYCQVILDRMRKLDPTLIIKRNGVIYE